MVSHEDSRARTHQRKEQFQRRRLTHLVNDCIVEKRMAIVAQSAVTFVATDSHHIALRDEIMLEVVPVP
ncbi:hypothetical protein D3C86_1731780 [compost metagenome]